MKTRILRSFSIVFFAALCSAIVSRPAQAQSTIYSTLTLVGSVRTGSYSAVSGIIATPIPGGYYSNGIPLTNYYCFCGTNLAGSIPLSTNVVVTWTPGSGTNSVLLQWVRAPGVFRQILLQSFDAGVTWTNWITLPPGTTAWIDTGSNVWMYGNFTNLFPAIPPATYPWPTNALTDATMFATAAEGVSGTDAEARVAVLESIISRPFTPEDQLGFSDDGTINSIRTTNTVLIIPPSIRGIPVLHIGSGAGNGSQQIQSLEIPDSVLDIDYSAFSEDYSLNNLNLGRGLQIIGYAAFYGCTNLTTVTIPASVTSIAGQAFGYDPALQRVCFAGVPPIMDPTAFQGSPNVSFEYANRTVTAPLSNSAPGQVGEIATDVEGGTNWFYVYDPNGGGSGIGAWLRIQGDITW